MLTNLIHWQNLACRAVAHNTFMYLLSLWLHALLKRGVSIFSFVCNSKPPLVDYRPWILHPKRSWCCCWSRIVVGWWGWCRSGSPFPRKKVQMWLVVGRSPSACAFHWLASLLPGPVSSVLSFEAALWVSCAIAAVAGCCVLPAVCVDVRSVGCRYAIKCTVSLSWGRITPGTSADHMTACQVSVLCILWMNMLTYLPYLQLPMSYICHAWYAAHWVCVLSFLLL